MKLSHLDQAGRARMVDVGDKPLMDRTAVASGTIRMSPEAFRQVADQAVEKGDVLTVTEVAGTLAAKRTAELIPLCHPLGLDHVEVEASLVESLPGIRVRASVRTVGRTGVEMEALTAVAVALLTAYDMVKAVDAAMVIGDVQLVEKKRLRSMVERRLMQLPQASLAGVEQERSMETKTQRLMLRGGVIVLAALLVSTVGGWAGGTTAESERVPTSGTELLGELRALRQQLDAKQGELEVARLQLERVDAIMQYSTHYRLPADLATAIYDVALSEGIDPGLAFRLVKVESGFNPRATSHVGALGLTQVLPSTARLYEPGLTTQQLYDRDTNLRIGFRYLRDLLDRYPTNMQLALLAYNRGPAKVEQLLGAGRDPANGYETEVMKGFRHH